MDREDGDGKEAKQRKDKIRGKSSSPRTTPARQRHTTLQKQASEEESKVVEESMSAELDSWIKLNAKGLKIRQLDRRWAAEMVNDFRDNLLKFLRLNSDEPFQSAEFLNSGSYFEKVKIRSADEFDMMLKLRVSPRLMTEALDNGLFYHIRLARMPLPVNPIRAFVLDEHMLSSSKILSEMYCLVRKFLKTYKVPDSDFLWVVNRKRPRSPAVTLSLYRKDTCGDELISVDLVPALEVQSWPVGVRSGPDVDNWLGKKFRQEIRRLAIFYVPKRLKGQTESWRISFSHIEKTLIRKHGNKKTCCESNITKCCRKLCYMLLKSLIEGLKLRFPKELDPLCSYHGKTVFLHTMSTRFDDAMWTPQQLTACFRDLFRAMESHARRGLLPHFFVPECNLFSPAVFPPKALAFLVSVLEEQWREGLPLLKLPAPVPPIRAMSPSEDTSPEVSTDVSATLTTFLPLFALALVFVLFLKFGLRV
uniref:cyclic GMP-AMP synthase-like isoform X1 n=1 Tax=Gasterosteus aculeatus aculeatus TaxID=481459 RepID=UPI001A9899DC|nr:cyclic GMP-AMP synthase-like isoform X1 [Gasterosteus aculeatus aculeatus]XP_040045501.1 cyclic GMP-AMP synthase-like isoform X1 [Gasterosteus aculeatus aculeatus]